MAAESSESRHFCDETIFQIGKLTALGESVLFDGDLLTSLASRADVQGVQPTNITLRERERASEQYHNGRIMRYSLSNTKTLIISIFATDRWWTSSFFDICIDLSVKVEDLLRSEGLLLCC